MIAVVSGAGAEPSGDGLGSATCRALADRGYAVAAWDADAQALERTVVSASPHAARVVDPAAPDAIERAFADLDEPPALVVNRLVACGREPARFEDMPPAELEARLTSAVAGAAIVCLLAVQRMRDAGRGVLVNVTSSLARFPAPLRLADGAADAALESLTVSLAAELAGSGVGVNAVALMPSALPNGAARDRARLDAADRPGPDPPTDAEVADAIAFLASPQASAMRGAVIRLDRGFDPFPGLGRDPARRRGRP